MADLVQWLGFQTVAFLFYLSGFFCWNVPSDCLPVEEPYRPDPLSSSCFPLLGGHWAILQNGGTGGNARSYRQRFDEAGPRVLRFR